MKYLVIIASLGFAVAHASPPSDVRVIDGDTVNLSTTYVQNMPERISVRLIGVNTPETGKKAKCDKERELAEAAKLYVRDRVANAKDVKVNFKKWDKYGGRIDGYLLVDGSDIAQELIKNGMAVPYSGGQRANVWCK